MQVSSLLHRTRPGTRPIRGWRRTGRGPARRRCRLRRAAPRGRSPHIRRRRAVAPGRYESG